MDFRPDILATIASFFGTVVVIILAQFAMVRWFDKKNLDTRAELKNDIADWKRLK